MTTNKKAAPSGNAHAASKIHRKSNSISTAIWVMEYSLEEARQRHEALDQPLKRKLCSIGLALLRLIGGGMRHV